MNFTVITEQTASAAPQNKFHSTIFDISQQNTRFAIGAEKFKTTTFSEVVTVMTVMTVAVTKSGSCV
jgi:hypothetical protein